MNTFFKRLVLFSVFLFFVIANINVAQTDEQKKLVGRWSGTISMNGMSLRIVFNVDAKDGKLLSAMDSPDQNVKGIVVEETSVAGDSIKFSVASIHGLYEGKLTAEKNQIDGKWSQIGKIFPLTIKKESWEKKSSDEKQYLSYWEGKLKITAVVTLRLVLKPFKNDDGSLGAHLDSPDQGAKNIPASLFSMTEDSLKFEVKNIGARYSGKIYKDSSLIKGTFKQGTLDLPLELKKVDKVVELIRPQNPKKPYPYNEEEVVVENKTAKITLAGTLTTPKGAGPFPAVVMVTGSGPQDRDESLMNHKPFLVISDHLTRNGIAVLRCDDRGIGKSKGNFSTATTEDFATDAEAGVEFLKTRKEINSKKIGVIGHSEGGLIAPIVAVSSKDVAYIVMLAGPGLPGKDILLMQERLISKVSGEKDDQIDKMILLNGKIFDAILNEPDNAAADKKIKAIYEESYNTLTAEEKKIADSQKATIEMNMKQLTTPWFRYFMKYDPRPTLENVTVPVLALNGGNDLQVPPKEDLAEIEKALKSGGNKNFITVELPGLNHLFQHSKTGAVSEYGQIEETFSPEALKIISDWILQITK